VPAWQRRRSEDANYVLLFQEQSPDSLKVKRLHTLTACVCVCVCVCARAFGKRTSGWHADYDKYDDSDDIRVGSANRLWLLCIIKLGQLAELC
jgi:hypothetical protein